MRLCRFSASFVARAIEHAADVIGQLHEAGDERVIPRYVAVAAGRAGFRPSRPADGFEAAQFRAEQKQIDAAGNNAQVCVVQDHAPISVVGGRACIGDREVRRVARELRGRRASEEGVDCRGCGRRNIRRIGDAAAPGPPAAVIRING